MPYFLHRSLVKPFRAFEPRRRLGRTEGAEAGRLDVVDDAGDERIVRADHHEVDRELLAQRHDSRVVGQVDRHALGFLSRCRRCPARTRAWS